MPTVRGGYPAGGLHEPVQLPVPPMPARPRFLRRPFVTCSKPFRTAQLIRMSSPRSARKSTPTASSKSRNGLISPA